MNDHRIVEFFKWLAAFLGFVAVCWIFDKDFTGQSIWLRNWLFMSFISANILSVRVCEEYTFNYYYGLNRSLVKIAINFAFLFFPYFILIDGWVAFLYFVVKFSFFVVVFERIFIYFMHVGMLGYPEYRIHALRSK